MTIQEIKTQNAVLKKQWRTSRMPLNMLSEAETEPELLQLIYSMIGTMLMSA